MKAGIWYEADEKIPPKTGYYLAFKGYSMGDDEPDTGYYYWDAKKAEWADSSTSMRRHANVVYWTETDPEGWYEKYSLRTKAEVTVAEKDAWAEVEKALERYELVRALTKV